MGFQFSVLRGNTIHVTAEIRSLCLVVPAFNEATVFDGWRLAQFNVARIYELRGQGE